MFSAVHPTTGIAKMLPHGVASFDHSTTSEIIWVRRTRIRGQSRQRHLVLLRMQESAGSKMLPRAW